MMPEHDIAKQSPPFPWRCQRCRKKEVRPAVLPYRTQVRHDGVLHTVEVPNLTVPRCALCGELLFDNRANDQVSAALRAQLHLLTPEQIQAQRTALGLSPQELAVQLLMPDDAIQQLEDGLRVQSRALDNLLRLFFAVPQARSALAARQSPEFGTGAALAS